MLCLLFSSWRRKKRLFDKRPNEKSKMSPQAKHKTLVAQRRKILFFFEEVWGQIFLLVLVSTENRGESTVHFLYRCHFRLILLIRYCFNKKTFSHSTRGEILLRIVFCLSVVKKTNTQTTLAKQPKYVELMRCKCDIAVQAKKKSNNIEN